MSRLAALVATEARLLVRDWTVLVFAFAFPAFCMVTLAGVFGDQPDDGFAMRRPDDYYVAASIGVPVIALALVGLPVALASYRDRGVLRRLKAFGVSTAKVVAAQAAVTCALIAVATAVVLALAAPTYGIPHVEHPGQTVLGFAAGTVTLILLGVAGLGPRLGVLAAWAAAAILAVGWIVRRTSSERSLLKPAPSGGAALLRRVGLMLMDPDGGKRAANVGVATVPPRRSDLPPPAGSVAGCPGSVAGCPGSATGCPGSAAGCPGSAASTV
jgi:hypothetical protein